MTEPAIRDEQAPVPEILRILAPNPGPMTLTGTCTYVVRDGDQVWVLDPGPRDAAHLDAVVAATGVGRGARPAGVIVTHRHEDHAGGAGALRRRLQSLSGRPVPLWAADPAAVPGAESPPARLEGDRGVVGHVIHLPGHTADSIALLVIGGRLLIGDTLLGGSSTVIAPPDGSLTDYLRSLEVVRALGADGRISEILPGHGEPYEEPTSALGAVEDALSHRRARVEEVRRARERGLLTMPRLLREVYGDDLPAGLREAAEWNVRAAIDHISRTA